MFALLKSWFLVFSCRVLASWREHVTPSSFSGLSCSFTLRARSPGAPGNSVSDAVSRLAKVNAN
jgi:hypothetical protein